MLALVGSGAERRAGERYVVVRHLGRGGMGDVRLVRDAVRGQDVALKRVLEPRPAARIRFKREFRVVADLHHPHLVRLHDLGEDEEGLFFTMEAIDGVDLAAWCTEAPSTAASAVRTRAASAAETQAADTVRSDVGEAPTLDAASADPDPAPRARAPLARVDRVLATTPQLVDALAFLHARGVIHRDLKPGNVMVGPDGVVKLLDFGILASPAEHDAEVGRIAGTLGFMAPEQLRGAPPDPASDRYALGATLFVLLSGRDVFEAESAMQRMIAHQTREAPRLDTIVEGLPAELVALVAALLERDPAKRPTLDEVAAAFARLGAAPSPSLPAGRARVTLVGRELEVVAAVEGARAAVDGGPPVLLIGPSGSGKTALAQHVADRLASEGIQVLRARGRDNERIPFNALDAIVDRVALAFERAPTIEPAVRDQAAIAASIFPVLGDVAGGVAATSSRSEAFEALAALIAEVSGDAGALLLIDDLQWADVDSLRALWALRGAGLGILATLRDDVAADLASAWAKDTRAQRIAIGPLSSDALVAIARAAAAEAGVRPTDEALREAARLARGRPFLAEVAGRALALEPDEEPLARLVERAVERAPDVLAAVVAAGGWLPLGVLAQLLERGVGELGDLGRDLTHAGVLRRTGGGADASFDLYHDAVRAPVAAALAGRLGVAHGRFADLALAGALTMPTPRLVGHLLEASREAEAAAHAVDAADLAARQMAFGLEADMLEIALAHGEAPPDVRDRRMARRAEALERVGRYAVAAELWDTLSDARDGEAARTAMIRAAHARLGANQVEEGAARLDRALAVGGDGVLGRRGVREVWAALRFLSGPRGGEPSAREEPALRARAEADVRLGVLVGFFDPLQGVRILVRARDGFHHLGDASRLAWCDLLFAVFADYGHLGPEGSRLARRYREAGTRRASSLVGDTREHRAVERFLDGTAHGRRAEWGDALVGVRAAQRIFTNAGKRGSFEYAYCLTGIGFLAMGSQDLACIEEALGHFRDVTRESGDLSVTTHEAMNEVFLRCYQGDEAGARAAVARAEEALPKTIRTIQRPWVAILSCLPEVCFGDPRGVLDRLIGALPEARRFGLFDFNFAAIYVDIAARTEVLAWLAGDGRASPRRIRRWLRILDRSAPVMAGVAARMRAYLAERRGDAEACRALLAASAHAAEAGGRPIDAAVARFQLGLRTPGAAGEELRATAVADARARGADPAYLDELRWIEDARDAADRA